MSQKILSTKQARLFSALEREGTLLLCAGPAGISADINGHFAVQRWGEEDVLCMGDGTNHVHIDWSRLSHVELGVSGGQGMLKFKEGPRDLFQLYRKDGPYSSSIAELAGPLLEASVLGLTQ